MLKGSPYKLLICIKLFSISGSNHPFLPKGYILLAINYVYGRIKYGVTIILFRGDILKIKLVDYMMGVGKSSYILDKVIDWSNEGLYEQFIYISPLLSEVGGKRKDKGKGFLKGRVQEKADCMNFKFPVNMGKSKVDSFRDLLLKGNNISATHSVFTNLTPLDVELIRERKNVLIIDEEVQALDTYSDMGDQHLKVLISGGQVFVDKDSKVCWNHKDFPQSEEFLNNPNEDYYSKKDIDLSKFINLCDGGYLHLVNKKIMIWEYPMVVLEAFDEVIVMTYMFEASPMASWCKINGVEVEKLIIPELEEKQLKVKENIKSLITVVETPKIKTVENYGFSYSWWIGTGNNRDYQTKVKESLQDCVKNHLGGNITYRDFVFTCPEKAFPKIKGVGYSRADWLYSDCKATNDYAGKKVMFYLYSKFPNIFISPFCKAKGASIDDDMYALSSMLQWLWRGCIRKGEPMKVVIASKRMRDLFKDWINEGEV